MWVAGRQYGDLQRALYPSVDLTYSGDDDSSPLGLDARVISLLTDGIALNSTAELRAGEGTPLQTAALLWLLVSHSVLWFGFVRAFASTFDPFSLCGLLLAYMQ